MKENGGEISREKTIVRTSVIGIVANVFLAAFKAATGTRNACHVTYVTTYGVQNGRHSAVMQSQVIMDDLFAE